jgi:hypothetical protein
MSGNIIEAEWYGPCTHWSLDEILEEINAELEDTEKVTTEDIDMSSIWVKWNTLHITVRGEEYEFEGDYDQEIDMKNPRRIFLLDSGYGKIETLVE